jgi:hypothetical protein
MSLHRDVKILPQKSYHVTHHLPLHTSLPVSCTQKASIITRSTAQRAADVPPRPTLRSHGGVTCSHHARHVSKKTRADSVAVATLE